ncbi:MAG: CPBP family intramembrane metalloprotease [Lachnospiraceae bacterium]|nr:CPBP family intramembrane metalloprotease [Lachnospiraceae bacterium]
MKKFYEKNEVLFAVAWIVAYCVAMSALKGNFGYASVWMLLGLIVFTAGITAFVLINKLKEKYGLNGFPKDMKKYLFFIPMFVLATGNLWDGFSLSYSGVELLIATLSMILVGYVEEMIFRGFLFKAMLGNGKAITAIIVSSVTFGIGHIINLLTGQAGFETVMQVIFAIAWGFLLTMVFYKSGSLIPCIIAHAMIDALSLYGADTDLGGWIYIGVSIPVSIVYCIYLEK